jgi:protein SCO1/2
MKTYPTLIMSALLLAMTAATGNLLADTMADPHAHHHMMMQRTSISQVNYDVPTVRLVRDDGMAVSLTDELNDGRPVILNFIYTTCTTVCPVTSHTFEQLQEMLGEERNKVHMISISIDPEQDTPERLAAYARKYEAAPQWHFYTGTNEASLTAQRAFDVYRGDKMNHSPVTLLRAAPGKSWLRIEGFASAEDLLREYRALSSVR